MTETPAPRRTIVDLETTGLDVRLHWAYELALIHEEDPEPVVYSLPHSLVYADRFALGVGGYVERGFAPHPAPPGTHPIARTLASELEGRTLVGANVAFDARFLEKLIGYAPWHYRLLDVESMAYARGYRSDGGGVPGLGDLCSQVLGLERSGIHTAAGDAVATFRIFEEFERS